MTTVSAGKVPTGGLFYRGFLFLTVSFLPSKFVIEYDRVTILILSMDTVIAQDTLSGRSGASLRRFLVPLALKTDCHNVKFRFF